MQCDRKQNDGLSKEGIDPCGLGSKETMVKKQGMKTEGIASNLRLYESVDTLKFWNMIFVSCCGPFYAYQLK